MEQVLYKLPDGWEWSNLTDICTPSRKTVEPNPEEQYNYIGLENIESHTGKVISDSPTKGSEISSTKVSFKKGMVLYGKLRPYLNKVVVAKIDGIATTEIIPFECSDAISPDFLAYYLRSQYFVDLAMNNCSGARMPRATTKLFTQIAKVPVTSITEQKRIVEKLDALLTRIDSAIEHLQESVTLADALYASTINEQMMQAIELAGLSTVEKHIEQIQTGTTPPTKQPEFYENGDINWFAPSDFGDHDILFDSNKNSVKKHLMQAKLVSLMLVRSCSSPLARPSVRSVI
ncbi:restriction endonuclease subunit S [Proteus mirabilis]|uniref:Restriction endonuclease subunit S n=1 Tax=Proteus mirabilis TaxID=584 RepID=A0ABD5LXL8_PROMI